MASECLATPFSMTEAQQLRAQADQLLRNLVTDRDGSDRRHLEAGKRDPLRLVTGKSALDEAIASAQEMIAAMDSVIAEISGEADVLAPTTHVPPLVEVRLSEQRRPRFRSGLRAAINSSLRPKPVPAVS